MAERGRPRAFDRAAALQKAMLLFWEKGFQGASMSELTGAMGINAPSLYACFGSKEALYREAMALYESGDGAELAAAIAAAPTVREAIEIYLMRSAALFSRPDKPAGCMVVLSVVHAAGTSAEAGRALRDARTEMQGVLETRLRGAIARGELQAGDPAAIAAFYCTVQQGMSVRARDGASRAELEAVAQGAMAAWPGLTGARA
ncbi:DNA-binding transcriptional regulator, AcrR family [Bosea sp. 62]|uniref:TetR/AcrR family transcriptional regulator n=1 Tax=unclassified Bosea (in: a-proteobacteria) TaxID=2653178 RepID=UPI0012590460|nr:MULTISPECIES: TetR/AcrR family transcriptional regulator [unclassified Bosea (in: a-proteobacteria)]CAD5247876.1 DNA-binding transcriptional regulator, AcrR family [Bosea sp. 21B]CAD5270309.1 DNA-binding transcriptional regulator, AcrR family [Bosea sp. 46]VVT51036.1 DNA-binding transcriptional regulator, AcrR family [Bosea sp. EC-HK365B]VXB96830.1 DNA-binding transcriptional regulator, AcrR family [Bosea sp. 62]VXC05441.1 DNA-binding transcriptional regulator, AcrR family [Bosea sp. 29B]